MALNGFLTSGQRRSTPNGLPKLKDMEARCNLHVSKGSMANIV